MANIPERDTECRSSVAPPLQDKTGAADALFPTGEIFDPETRYTRALGFGTVLASVSDAIQNP